MKISKRQLRQIIKEEKTWTTPEGWDVKAGDRVKITTAQTGKSGHLSTGRTGTVSDIGWGNRGLPSDDPIRQLYLDLILDDDPSKDPMLNSISTQDVELIPEGIERIRITKRQLRRIIKEAVLREGIADPRGLKALLASLNVKGRDFGPVANALALAYHDSEGAPQDMKDEVEVHSGGLSTSTDGEWIDWPIETYQEIWNLFKKAEQSYRPSQAPGPRF